MTWKFELWSYSDLIESWTLFFELSHENIQKIFAGKNIFSDIFDISVKNIIGMYTLG